MLTVEPWEGRKRALMHLRSLNVSVKSLVLLRLMKYPTSIAFCNHAVTIDYPTDRVQVKHLLLIFRNKTKIRHTWFGYYLYIDGFNVNQSASINFYYLLCVNLEFSCDKHYACAIHRLYKNLFVLLYLRSLGSGNISCLSRLPQKF